MMEQALFTRNCWFYSLFLLLMTYSCGKETVFSALKGEVSIEMTSSSTNTTLSGKKVLWNDSDAISVFDGEDNCKFVSKGKGAVSSFVGDANQKDHYLALYPYDGNATVNGDVISTVLPSDQIANAESFALEANLSVTRTVVENGKHSGLFRNVGCYLRLTLPITMTGIHDITVTALGGETLSGSILVGVDELGFPFADESGGSSHVRLIAPDGFLEAGNYYLVLLPQHLSEGLEITVNGDEVYSLEIDNLFELKRNTVYSFTLWDTEWNNWKTKSDVIDRFLSAQTKRKTYFSMFKFFNFESSGELSQSKLSRYGLPFIYGVDFYKAFGTYFPKESRAAIQNNLGSIIQKAWSSCRSIPSFSWHLESPYAVYDDFCVRQGQTMGCRYVYGKPDVADNFPAKYRYQVRDILNNRQIDTLGIHCLGEWFDDRVREIADFINTLVDQDGQPIPVILRLWHELEDSWAWWQVSSYKYVNCSKDEYISLFRLTVGKLRNYCPNAIILFAFCTDRYFSSASEYLTCYPGDDYVDIIGYDDYSIGDTDSYSGSKTLALKSLLNRARIVSGIAREKGIPAAIFETNNAYESTAARNFYNDYVQPILQDSSTSFSLFQLWSTSDNTVVKREALQEFIRQDNIIFGRLP